MIGRITMEMQRFANRALRIGRLSQDGQQAKRTRWKCRMFESKTGMDLPDTALAASPPGASIRSAAFWIGWAVMSSTLAATDAPVSNRLAGMWQLSSPHVSCDVTLKITTDGAATLMQGARTSRWKFELEDTTESNDWKIVNQVVGTDDAQGCAFPKYVQPGFGRETYVRFLAEDRKMTLCTTDNIGGCNQWFDRVGRPPAAPAPTASTRVERAVYRAAPEQPGLFELVPKDPMPVLIADLSGRQFEQRPCGAMFAWDVGGAYGQPFGELRVASCKEADAYAKIGRDMADSELVRSLHELPLTPDDRLRYGASYAAESMLGGARLYAFPTGIEVGIQLNTVIWVPAGGKPAVVVQLVAMAECEPGKPYVEAPLCKDRWAVLRKIAVEAARLRLQGPQ
jgi:hypothetical protein